MEDEIKKLGDFIEDNIYQIKSPNFGDTDCGSERIVNAVVNITLEAFRLSLEKSDLIQESKRYFCGDDLLKRAIDEISKQLTPLANGIIKQSGSK